MSRGGRGGFGGRPRIGGVEVPWNDIDYSSSKNYLPDQDYPPISKPAFQKPPRPAERRQVAAYRRLRSNVHEGDFYTVHALLGGDASISTTATASTGGRRARGAPAPAAAPRFDAFDSMQTYTHKYTKQRRRLPRLHGRPFVMRFFPRELWSTIDPAYGAAPSGGQQQQQQQQQQQKRRALRIHGASRRSRMELAMERAEEAAGAGGASAAAAAGADGEDGAGEGEERERGDAPDDELEKDGFDDEPVDDDFGEDEDDMDDENDYNAERYFDGGDEDGGDDDYGGGGMGEDEY